MAILEVSIIPIGSGTASVSEYVARAINTLNKHQDVAYELTPMGTILQGELDSLITAVKDMHESVFDDKIRRVYTRVVIDDRRDKRKLTKDKVASVQEKLGS